MPAYICTEASGGLQKWSGTAPPDNDAVVAVSSLKTLLQPCEIKVDNKKERIYVIGKTRE